MAEATTRRGDTLEDWFDGVAVLVGEEVDRGRFLALARSVAGDLPVADLTGAPEGAQARLRERGLNRPLVLVCGADVPPSLRERRFTVTVGGGASSGFDLSTPADVTPSALRDAACARVSELLARPKKLNILILYCDVFTNIETINEHLRSFSLYSDHNIFYFPASDTAHMRIFEGMEGAWPNSWDLDLFDVVVWHYVVPAYLKERLSPLVAERLAAYDGLKILFVQDEYDNTATTTAWMERVGIDLMFTCVPPDGLDYAYPPERRRGVEFFRTLTGYLPEDHGLEAFIQPMASRRLRLAYRGRHLPYRYGALAREKYSIGVEMRRLAALYGVEADIAVDEESRIYGTDWYRFLGSARATLATESGSNVFDFDGNLKSVGEQAEQSGMSFEDFQTQHLLDLEGVVKMNQVSPKIFEAVRLRTALVCFRGDYSGVIKPDIHYIPLEKDFSNAAEVFEKLEDTALLAAMTERAYADVIGSGRYSYAAFVGEFDSIIGARILREPRSEIVSAPLLTRRRGATAYEPVVRSSPFEYILNTGVLRNDLQRRDLEELVEKVREAEIAPRRMQGALPPADAEGRRLYSPDEVVCYDFWRNAGAEVETLEAAARITTPTQAWHYAAGVNLDLSELDFEHEHAWLRVKLRDVRGEFRTSLYEADVDRLGGERAVLDADEATLHLKVTAKSMSLLLFRTGQYNAAATALFVEAELLSASAYPPPVVNTARRLSELRKGAFSWWP